VLRKQWILEPSSNRSEPRRTVSLLVLAVVVGVAVWQGLASCRKVTRQTLVAAACDAAAGGRWNEVLALSEGLVGSDPDGQIAAGCRCTALMALDRKPECADLVAAVSGDGSANASQLPASLIHIAARSKIERSAFPEARKLVAWARRTYPDDPKLIQDEFEVRLATEDSRMVLAEYQTILARDESSLGLRVTLAKASLREGDPESGLHVLGEHWPPPTSPVFVALVLCARAVGRSAGRSCRLEAELRQDARHPRRYRGTRCALCAASQRIRHLRPRSQSHRFCSGRPWTARMRSTTTTW